MSVRHGQLIPSGADGQVSSRRSAPAGTGTRSRARRSPVAKITLTLIVVASLALAACGGGDDGNEVQGPASGDGNPVTVAELLASAPSEEVAVRGLLFDDGDGLLLCEALAESFPPQCPSTSVVISNPEVVEADFTSEGGVRWTDAPVTLVGALGVDGFEVSLGR